MLSLPLHLSIHLFFSLLAGLIVWLFFRRNLFLALFGGILGGFLVDFDHFIDYFLAFGWHFNFYWFSKGFEFLKSDRIYLFFHAWEYVIILIIAVIILKKRFSKTRLFLFSIALGLLFHLTGDVIMNEGMKLQSYSLIYRIKNNFKTEQLVTPGHYQYNIEKRQKPEIREIINK
jgi:hypothetical protein